ncbi:hypothetical protein CU098_000897, partial [Rhizopus stolonifer]
FGHNKLESKEVNPILQFLGFMWNPLSWVMEAAAIVSIALSNGGGQPPDYPDFIGIVLLLLANATIGFLEERQAGNAVKALMASLAPECKVKRSGEWKTLEAAELVPGDVISIKLGDVVPADDGVEGKYANSGIYHSVIYLQVSTISQALIFITRSRGFFFSERPSIMLMCAFIVAQLVATFIAVYANWGFTHIQPCGWNWAGIVWIWNIIWFLPMDFIKFAMRYAFEPKSNNPKDVKANASRRASAISATSSARYYANRTKSLRSMERPQNFAQKLIGKSGKTMDAKEMRRFSSVQTSQAAQVLNKQ